MAQHPIKSGPLNARLRLPLTLTWAGLLAERLVRAFWPLWTLLVAVAAALMLGLQDILVFELATSVLIAATLGAAALLVVGIARFHWPRRGEALARLDAGLPGRPLQALGDAQAVGRGDAASEALWQAHRARMEQAARAARAPRPNLRIARLDPFGLRYIALLGLVVALLFGSVWRVTSAVHLTQGRAQPLGGPAWEGWIEPPAYTGLPSLYLADQPDRRLDIPTGSRVTLRFYGQVGALALAETVSGRTTGIGAATDTEQSFDVTQNGTLAIDGPGGRKWDIRVIPDAPPTAEVSGEHARTTVDGQMSQPFAAQDDYGVTGGTATFDLVLADVDRRYGLAPEPEPRAPIVLDLPLPITGDRARFKEVLVDNLSQHPWAHLPVRLTIKVEDAAGQTGTSNPLTMDLPARRFFDPVAAAVIEQRRDLLWSAANAPRVAQVLRAITYKPEDSLFRNKADYLKLRTIMRRLEAQTKDGTLPGDARDKLAQALWDLAVALEDGDTADALERMREAQERLSEAMRNGADEDEIARLMQELRDATDDYLRQKSQMAQREDGADQPDSDQQQGTTLSQQDLQDMMDRIEDLMREGRMAEAEEALRQFQQMMENLRITQDEGGEGEGSPGGEAMQGLADTLRQQQGLSDEAFRDLQQQFNRGTGSSPGEGEGQGEKGEGKGKGTGPLADRQQALREELERQRGSLPGSGEAAEGARGALDRAGEAMRDAEESLRDKDMAGALDSQSEAIDALREGMRGLGEAMAEENGARQGGQGQAQGGTGTPQSDPLGRQAGQGGGIGTEGDLLQGEDVYRRARELLDELRRRSGESARPEVERDYLRRLLDRF